MDPRDFFKKGKEKEKDTELYFALQISDHCLKGAIWAIEESKTKVFTLTSPVDWKEEQEIITGADKVFSQAVEKLGLSGKKEPQKIIFGLPFAWVKGEKILPDHLKILKKLCHELDLKPVGFVVTPEAIVKYLKDLEGVPPSAILIHLGKKEIEVILLRLGKIRGKAIVVSSGQLGEDLAEGLAQIASKDVLPARVILYDSDQKVDEKKEEILDFPWQKEENRFNFLHLPKVETVGVEFDIRAVALAGGSEVAKSLGIKTEISSESGQLGNKEAAEESKEEKKESLMAEKEIGFDFDSKQDFVTQGDQVSPGSSPGGTGKEDPERFEDQTENNSKSLEKKKTRFKFPRFKLAVLNKLKLSLSWFRFKKLPLLILLLVSILLGLGGGFFYLWWYLPKAEVVLFVKSESLEKDFQITLDAQADESNLTEMILPALVISETIEDKGKKATTGTKLIGEKAQGEVTIFNRSPEEKILSGGTILVGPGEIRFSLDEEAIVASENEGADYTLIPGKTKVAATALVIGSEGNLAAGTEFTVDKYSKTNLIARSEVGFSGGSSREIKVVSQKDLDDLQEKILAQLSLEAKERLIAKTSSDQFLVEASFAKKIISQEFDKQLKEEAESVSLTQTIEFTSLSYQKALLNNLIKERIKSSIPSGYEFKEEESDVNFSLKEVVSKDQALFDASFKVILWPKLEIEQIRGHLRGKKPAIGEFYLNSLPSLSGFEVVFTPSLPDFLETFPRFLENIQVEVQSTPV
ncbi:hypothetical protein ACFLZP_01540 [Patescibacteria group bacterium]